MFIHAVFCIPGNMIALCKILNQICIMQIIEQKYNNQVSHRMDSYLHSFRCNYISAYIKRLCASGDLRISHFIPDADQFSKYSINDADAMLRLETNTKYKCRG